MQIDSVKNCKEIDQMPSKFNGTFKIINSIFYVNGQLIVDKKLYGPYEVEIDVTKCDLNRAHCEEHDKIVFKNICDKLLIKKSFWALFATNIEPKFVCPFQKV